MNITYGHSRSNEGPGVTISLTGDEAATAIDAYLKAHNIHVSGPRTITVNHDLIEEASIYVDPSGFVIREGMKFSGKGRNDCARTTHGLSDQEAALGSP